MNKVILLKGYNGNFKKSSFINLTTASVSPRYELFNERYSKRVTVVTKVNVRRGVSILFKLQNIASSIDSSIVTRYTLYPVSFVCKVLAKRHKRKLAIEILALTNKAEDR